MRYAILILVQIVFFATSLQALEIDCGSHFLKLLIPEDYEQLENLSFEFYAQAVFPSLDDAHTRFLCHCRKKTTTGDNAFIEKTGFEFFTINRMISKKYEMVQNFAEYRQFTVDEVNTGLKLQYPELSSEQLKQQFTILMEYPIATFDKLTAKAGFNVPGIVGWIKAPNQVDIFVSSVSYRFGSVLAPDSRDPKSLAEAERRQRKAPPIKFVTFTLPVRITDEVILVTLSRPLALEINDRQGLNEVTNIARALQNNHAVHSDFSEFYQNRVADWRRKATKDFKVRSADIQIEFSLPASWVATDNNPETMSFMTTQDGCGTFIFKIVNYSPPFFVRWLLPATDDGRGLVDIIDDPADIAFSNYEIESSATVEVCGTSGWLIDYASTLTGNQSGNQMSRMTGVQFLKHKMVVYIGFGVLEKQGQDQRAAAALREFKPHLLELLRSVTISKVD